MKSYIVHGDKIIFEPMAGAAIVTAPPAAFIVTSNIGVAMGSKKNLAIEDDLKNVKVSATYISSAFVGGTGLVTLINWPKVSSKTTKKKKGVLTHGGKGKYKLSVVTPAINPSGVVDPTPIYNGSFTSVPSQFVFTEK